MEFNIARMKLQTIIAFIICSCKSKEQIYKSNSNRDVINIVNDSTINFTKLLGCIGGSKDFKYTKSNTILEIEKVFTKNNSSLVPLIDVFYGQEFTYSNDSLVNINTGEKYYSLNYLKRNKREAIFYVIHESKKYKITKKNYLKSNLQKINSMEYNFIEMDKNIALEKYGISKKYNTLESIRR